MMSKVNTKASLRHATLPHCSDASARTQPLGVSGVSEAFQVFSECRLLVGWMPVLL